MTPPRHVPSVRSRLASHPARHTGGARPWVLGGVVAAALATGGWWWTHRPAADGAVAADGRASGASGAGGPAGAGTNGGNGGGRRMGGGGPQPVSVKTVSRRDIPVRVQAIGTLTASNTAVVRAQVSGVLQRLNVQEGQQVKAGQTLAQIDPRPFQATLAQAEGTLARDRALLDNARLDLARYKSLLAQDALSGQQVDTQAALVRQLEGTVKADQASVDAARLQVAYAQVLSPISGRVGLKQVDVGNIVQANDTNGVFTVTQTQPMALVFSVPSSVVPALTAGVKSRQAMTVQALDRGTQALLAEGGVATIDNAIDTATDTIKVKALFPNRDDTLFPNQAVSVSLQVDVRKQVLAVPNAAVLKGAKGFQVFVVGADSKVTATMVQPGVSDGGWTAVEGELKPGDQVVVDGVDRLREGAKVEVITPERRGGGEGKGKGPRGKPGAGEAGAQGGSGWGGEGRRARPGASGASSASTTSAS